MKKLFLSSSFKDVASLLSNFAGEEIKGKTVTFIPTASIPETVTFYVGAGRKALEKLGLIIDVLEISTASASDITGKLKRNDYVYVSGGNTFFLLQELKKTGADLLVLEHINSGKLYIGESAGSMIMSPNIEYVKDMDDCKKAVELNIFDALGVIDFYPIPHQGNFPFKKAVEKIIGKYEQALELYPINNSQVILVDDESVRVESV